MIVQSIKEQEGSLKKLKSLLEDDKRKVHGVFYTNTFFSQRYLCRSHVLKDDINLQEDKVELTITTRLEQVGLMEIENTLEMLVEHRAGDLPGISPEGMFDDPTVDRPSTPELVSVNQYLYSIDVLLIMQSPKITYQEFTIAGTKFTLVNIHHELEEGFDQTVTLLFGEADKMYFFSHFYDKDLTVRDLKLILDLIVDENITGKAIKGVKVDLPSGVSSSIFPYEELISSYMNLSGDIIFGTGAGYVKVPYSELGSYKLHCEPNGQTGAYRLDLIGSKQTISLFME